MDCLIQLPLAFHILQLVLTLVGIVSEVSDSATTWAALLGWGRNSLHLLRLLLVLLLVTLNEYSSSSFVDGFLFNVPTRAVHVASVTSSPLSITTSTTATTTTTTTTTTSTSLYMNKKGGKNKKKKKTSPANTGGGNGFGTSAATSTTTSTTSTTTTTTTGPTAVQQQPSQNDHFRYAGDIRPGIQTPQKIVVDESIAKPDYAIDGTPKAKGNLLPWVVEVKTSTEIEKMRVAGQVAREVLDTAGRAIQPGITTDEIDVIVHEECLKRGAYPSPLNYHGFPKSCCTSVNEVICHGIPDDRKLKEGDIVNLDITCYVDGYHGDCSEMFVVPRNKNPHEPDDIDIDIDDDTRRLLQTTYDSWLLAMEFVGPGKDYKDIGAIIEDYVTPRGFTTVRNFCGHGIGSVFHTNPNILHYRNNEPNGQMAAGHTFTIEPMICEGSPRALTWPDEWTATTIDGKRSAQFEHTLLITSDGVEALTGKIEGSPLQFWERDSKIHSGYWLGNTKEAKQRAKELTDKATAV
mmetsp:Transcript_28898/g.40879  ORF Transcript_28898/g.40879 Transcript_28898/m.40879 type:complete len:519 (+) Transcript_28898:2189-3745(+)